ncbi:MAG: preprotein translocase subunit YajC [Kiritimatiellae bacterium]|nr:preprotein translocase subunit YajC [Kiritimatiellia bacterium]MDW8458208.1 preprotein translocase subunit YajC [Verrucomicrobiota bacterium]
MRFCMLAMAPPPGAESEQSPLFMFGWLAIMLLLFYVMLIRPQRRREKERQEMLSKIKTGDRVLFAGGIIGIVSNVKEKSVVIRVAEKTKLEVVKGAINQVLASGELPADVDQEHTPVSK